MKKYILVSGLIILLVSGVMYTLFIKSIMSCTMPVEVYEGNIFFSRPSSIAWQNIKVEDIEKLNDLLADNFIGYKIYITTNGNKLKTPSVVIVGDYGAGKLSFSKQEYNKLFDIISKWHLALPK